MARNSYGEQAVSVSELCAEVRSELERRFGYARVAGEISDLKPSSAGHLYFELKDARAALPAVMFRSQAMRLGGRLPAEGTEVECLGRLTLYEPRGRTQLVVDWLLPRGAGLLLQRLEERKRKLEAEGLFDPARKRPLPFWPRTIGVVTSPTGAALQDILHVLGRRMPSIPVLIWPVRVQGEGAAEAIAQAIERFSASARIDVLIVGRGGGSQEDLSAFNEEIVVRAVAGARVPVVSAVGHETDVVLSDLAADARAPTPSAAAAMVVPDRVELARLLATRGQALGRALRLNLGAARNRLLFLVGRLRDPRIALASRRIRLDELEREVRDALQKRLGRERRVLDELRRRLWAAEPRARLAAQRGRCADLAGRLARAMSTGLARRRAALESRRELLEGIGPTAVLRRGFSLVLDEAGRVVRDAAAVAPGERIEVRLERGALWARVEESRAGRAGGEVPS